VFVVAAEGLQPVGGRNLGEGSGWRLPGEPCQKPAQRRTVAPVGGANPFELHRILHRLCQSAGIGLGDGLGPGGSQTPRDPVGGSVGIDAHGFLDRAEPIEGWPQAFHRGNRHLFTQVFDKTGCQLAGIDEQLDGSIGVEHREGEGHGGIRHVAAADVQ
jgi:hypothetical protein